MKSLRRLVIGAVTFGLMAGFTVVAAAPAQAISGFSDGGFETPLATPGSFDRYFAPASLGPWTVSQGSVDLSGAGFWQNAEGNQSLDLDGTFERGGVTQTFSTIPLLKYKVSYKLAGNPASGPTIKTGQVLANGNVIQNFSFDITGKNFVNMGYVGKQTHFIATGLSSTLTFNSTTGSGYGPVIDKVEVESCLLVICLD
jgi:choice-of-anchor C domain-containing protein